MYSALVARLISTLQVLPGVGPKSAQRMAFYLLQREREGGKALAHCLMQAMAEVGYCQQCQMLSECDFCALCQNENRDKQWLCVVQNPADSVVIENTGAFTGTYFVLKGALSPIEGIGPQEIGIDLLLRRLEKDRIREVILATHATVEGEATAYYIAQILKKKNILATRIAHGVPLGGELEYVDSQTIARALSHRVEIVE